ncbi:hypothetical protein [Pseudomonas sp. DY-1]|uniref:hypothetical protein n=1 Tax=Pseudomonas sp. DY-1 TaxID=1755504 RepID=UPI00211467F7|nr:hypothetical protein [Pseudomonas sp. DY-1]
MREVTERDFRMPEFRDAKPEDYEFRDDGKVVRKDRWETGIRQIVSLLGNSRAKFEIPNVVEAVRKLVIDWYSPDPDEFPECDQIAIQLSCGSVLRHLERNGDGYRWPFSGQQFDRKDWGADVVGWIDERDMAAKEQQP